jgi:hypothetical protein
MMLVCVAAAVVACGSVPQPFRGTPKVTHDNPLLDVPAATGVAVLPVIGLSPEMSDTLTNAVANQLQAMEIPAAAVPEAGALGFIVSGQAEGMQDSATGKIFDVAWTVKSRHGAVVGHFVQTVHISPGDGAVPAAATTAHSIAGTMGLVDEPAVAQGPGNQPAAKDLLPTISVKPVDGAPGDGSQVLALAVLQALSDEGARRDDVNPDITLWGKVESVPSGLESQDVTISWRAVLRDGRELGVVKVRNTIPNGALDGPWGPTAFAIAGAAQKDLLRLITSAPPT